jgi:hypothetical protein
MTAKALLGILLPLFVCAAACTGEIGDLRDRSDRDLGRGGAGPDEPAALEGPRITSTARCEGQAEILPRRIVRLGPRGYANAVADLLGRVAVDPAEVPGNPLDDGYDTGAEHYVSDDLARHWHDQAKRLSPELATKTAKEHPCLGAAADAACIAEVVQDVVARAYRRPLVAAEIARYQSFFAEQKAAYGAGEATRMLAQAVLVEPWFLYRTELGGEGAAETVVDLEAHEVAAAIAALVVDGPPDRALRADAEAGKLRDRATVAGHVRRLLGTDAGRAQIRRFFFQYLRLDRLYDPSLAKDATAFPSWTPELRNQRRDQSERWRR